MHNGIVIKERLRRCDCDERQKGGRCNNAGTISKCRSSLNYIEFNNEVLKEVNEGLTWKDRFENLTSGNFDYPEGEQKPYI